MSNSKDITINQGDNARAAGRDYIEGNQILIEQVTINYKKPEVLFVPKILKLHIVYFEKDKIKNENKIEKFIEDTIIQKNLDAQDLSFSITTSQLLFFEQKILEDGKDKLNYVRLFKQEKILCKKIKLLFELIYKRYIFCLYGYEEIYFFTEILRNLIASDQSFKKNSTKLESYPRSYDKLSIKYSIKFRISDEILNELDLDGQGNKYFLEMLHGGKEIDAGEFHDVMSINFYTAAINSYIDNPLHKVIEKKDFFSMMGKYLALA